jgi:hypothetical protein
MLVRRLRWVAAIILGVSLSIPVPRTAQADEVDLWTATVEGLADSPFQLESDDDPLGGVFEEPADAGILGGQPGHTVASVRMEALAKAAAPTLSPSTGIFDGPVKVKCKTATRNSVIRYTTNGKTPGIRSPICRRGVLIKSTTTLKARAFRAGMKPSKVSSATIMIAPPAAGDIYNVQVAWTPQTTLVDKTQFGMLISTDPLNRLYVFNKSLAAGAGLDLSVGRVLIIYGIDFGKIASSTAAGNTVKVTLGPAKLGEAISDGVIDWDFAVPLSADRVQFVTPAGTVLAAQAPVGSGQATAAAPTPVVIKFKNGNFDYEITASLIGTAADLGITIKKDLVAPIGATFSVQAHLESYRAKNRFEVAGGQLQSWNSSTNGLKGDATLKLVVAGSGTDLKYEPRFTVMKVPFLIGPIPAALNIGVKVVVNAVVPIDGSASVETKFTYDSDVGFSYGGATANMSANLAGHTIGDPPAEPHAAASSQMGANFGIGFPQIGVAVGAGIEAGVWFRPAFIIGASWTGAPIPLCMTADARFLGAVGYDVTVFGFESNLLPSGSKTVFDFTKPLRRSGTCPP